MKLAKEAITADMSVACIPKKSNEYPEQEDLYTGHTYIPSSWNSYTLQYTPLTFQTLGGIAFLQGSSDCIANSDTICTIQLNLQGCQSKKIFKL